jgi:signal transduction histidine kinase
MTLATTRAERTGLPEEIRKRKRIIAGELRERCLWFIQLRWWVPPSIAAGSALAYLIGVKFPVGSMIAVAGFILAYNVLLSLCSPGRHEEIGDQTPRIQRFTYYQVALDYTAMFLLIHFTGGAASPLIFFFIFHLIFASILLPPRSAYGFAALAAGGMALTAALESKELGLLANHSIEFRGETIDLARQSIHVAIELGFFTASVFITAFTTTSIMNMLRKRILALADLSDTVTRLNNRLSSLYLMVETIGSERNLEKVLAIVTRELAAVMDVRAISVKLLSEDGLRLNYAAAYGLPEELITQKVVEVDKSPLNRRIIQGEPYTTGRFTQREMFQFGEDLAAARFQSVLFAPLSVEDRVIGILGAYCTRPDRFNGEEVEFFRLASGIAAIAVDNATSYQAMENLTQERSRFFLRIAHNLRAPLAAVLAMIEVLKVGHFGDLNPPQAEQISHVERRCRSMLELINELLTLANTRNKTETEGKKALAPEWLADRLHRTFEDAARDKKINLTAAVAKDLPPIWGQSDAIEQLLENLVSNALKYTLSGGRIGVVFSRAADNMIAIEVNDNGIGIPRDAMPKLFSEFYRAPNAKEVEELGTGLGLAIVKEIVERHEGRIHVESEEGCGTIFVVRLPAAPTQEVIS